MCIINLFVFRVGWHHRLSKALPRLHGIQGQWTHAEVLSHSIGWASIKYTYHIYIYVYLNVYIYIHICTSLTGTSLESNQVLLFQPLTLFLVFGTLNLHKGVVAIGAAYPSSNHFKHMKLQMFPFQFHQKKSTNMKPRSENMDVQLASLQCSGSINPRAATKLRELSRGGSFNPRDIQECRKKGGQSRQSPF